MAESVSFFKRDSGDFVINPFDTFMIFANLIKNIPWNVIKIDRSFLPVEEDAEDSTRMVLFKHAVSLIRNLGLECIAEGVETKEQVSLLKENNCELAQGYYYDKPLPKDQFEKKYLEV